MEGKTIATLAEYIANLKRENEDFFKDYEKNEFDTNGVEQDNLEKSWPFDSNERTST